MAMNVVLVVVLVGVVVIRFSKYSNLFISQPIVVKLWIHANILYISRAVLDF